MKLEELKDMLETQLTCVKYMIDFEKGCRFKQIVEEVEEEEDITQTVDELIEAVDLLLAKLRV